VLEFQTLQVLLLASGMVPSAELDRARDQLRQQRDEEDRLRKLLERSVPRTQLDVAADSARLAALEAERLGLLLQALCT
jgi:hypothetical protein